jgi:hypothetical protein
VNVNTVYDVPAAVPPNDAASVSAFVLQPGGAVVVVVGGDDVVLEDDVVVVGGLW